jgi:uncharacterized repeat protein (TIGR01451 family)
VAGGGEADTSNDSATDRVALDACPYGWSPEQTVNFAPPFRPGRPGGIDSGVRNATRANGCTLLDDIWSAEPFATHGSFVTKVRRETRAATRDGRLTQAQADRMLSAAERSDVGKKRDVQFDNTCPNRMALTFDDGTSSYRPKLLQVLRDEQVHATFFDNGVRVQANPRWAAFQVREGHIELNHTVLHLHMDEVPPEVNRQEVLDNEAILAAAGAPITFKGIRPPFGGSDPNVQQLLTSMGYTYFLNRIDGEDWLPDKSAEAIRDDILAQLHPGVIVGMHDGPIDTPAGAETVKAVRMIIDRARELGYCFGVVDHTGQVVADRYVSSGTRIPQLVNPVPYHLPLAFGTNDQIPEPWVRIPSPLQIAATHSPATFAQGQAGATLTLTVTNTSEKPTDTSAVTVTDAVPPGLTATAASGDGWTCTGSARPRCMRTGVLAPHASYPPITLTVDVAADAPVTITNSPSLLAHGEAWTSEASDAIAVTASG